MKFYSFKDLRRAVRAAFFPVLGLLTAASVPSVALVAQEAPRAATGEPAPATKPGPATTLSVEARLVTLPVTVRDKKGQLVTTLTKDDFALQEDGRAETVKYFSLDKDMPLSVGLIADTSMSMRGALDQERNAGKSFYDQMLATPADKAFLIHFDREVELLEDLTPSKEKLDAALLQLGPTRNENSSDSDDHHDTGPDVDGRADRHSGGTQLYDAIYLASDELLKKQPGRKAMVVLSDGGDSGSKETLNDAVESAQRAEASVYTIYFKGDEGPHDHGFGHQGGEQRGGGYPGGGGWPGSGGGHGGGGGQRRPEEAHVDGKKVMERIADETGGRFFEAKKKENLDEIYKAIAEELRTQYVLGYTPDKDSPAEGYHKILLTAKNKDLSLQTRPGYYADR